MCAIESLPECPGAPPVWRIHATSFRRPYPSTMGNPLDRLPDLGRAPGVHPDDGPAERPPVPVDRHRSRPLRAARGADHRPRVDPGLPQNAPGRGHHPAPPLLGILFGPAARQQCRANGSYARPTISPPVVTSASFRPEVPRSIARTCSAAFPGALTPSGPPAGAGRAPWPRPPP